MGLVYRRTSLAVPAVLLAVLTNCRGTPPRPGLDLRTMLSATLDLENERSCRWYERCCSAAERQAEPVADYVALCTPERRRATLEQVVSFFESSIRRGRLAIDPSAAHA